MGKNRSSKSQRSYKRSNSFQRSYKVSNTDARSYKNVDSRQYSKTDSRQYSNTDSRDMSTTVNNIDNKNISKTALNCGVAVSDVKNYTNDESININQDNSQNIVITGDGNTLENVTQKMNLTSYAPSVQKCMQDAVTNMSSKNKTGLESSSANSTAVSSKSDNKSAMSSDNRLSSSNDISTRQSSSMRSSQRQSSSQKASSTQSAGMAAAAAGGGEVIMYLIIIGIIYYFIESKNDFSNLKLEGLFNKNFVYILVFIFLVSSFKNSI